MKITSAYKMSRKNGYHSDDDNIRYMINSGFSSTVRSPASKTPAVKKSNEEDDVRYMFPTVLSKPKPVDRKTKPKIKVNFWSTKPTSRVHEKSEVNRVKSARRHTIAATSKDPSPPKPKRSIVKVRKQVSFLPSPLFSDNHVPMVTVPDDLTIQLNEEEANDLADDLNHGFVNDFTRNNTNDSAVKRKNRSSMTQTSPKRKRSAEDAGPRIHGTEHELEFFTKYVVQKLRRMETNQRIYSENLINTVLMLGQLGKLNGKSKVGEA